MKKLALIGLMLVLTWIAIAVPSGSANATPLTCDECTSQYIACNQECYAEFMPGNLPACQACQTDCRRAFKSCRVGCIL
jgi:hypothetical protein